MWRLAYPSRPVDSRFCACVQHAVYSNSIGDYCSRFKPRASPIALPIFWLTSRRNSLVGRLKAIIKRLRHLNSVAERPIYIGHKENRIYHRQDCKYAMRMKRGRRFLYTQKQALAERFRPCNSCRPDRNPYSLDEKRPGFWETFRKTSSWE